MCVRIPECYEDMKKDAAIVRNILHDLKEGNRDKYLPDDFNPDMTLDKMIKEQPAHDAHATQIINYQRGPFHQVYDVKENQVVIELQQGSAHKGRILTYNLLKGNSVQYAGELFSWDGY